MKRFERIAFVVIAENENGLIKPIITFKSKEFPYEQPFEFRVGFVGLRPQSRYYFKINISPLHLVVKVGEQFNINEAIVESTKMFINTQSGNMDLGVDGQLNVNLGTVKVVAKGIYQVACHLTEEDDDKETSLDSHTTFFSVE